MRAEPPDVAVSCGCECSGRATGESAHLQAPKDLLNPEMIAEGVRQSQVAPCRVDFMDGSLAHLLGPRRSESYGTSARSTAFAGNEQVCSMNDGFCVRNLAAARAQTTVSRQVT